MSDNIFFDLRKLKHLGRGSIVGKTVRIRYPELVSIGDHTIIDDFTYISTACEIGDHVHVASNCAFVGGPLSRVVLEDKTTVSTHCTLAAVADALDGLGGYSYLPDMGLAGTTGPGFVHLKCLAIVFSHGTIGPNCTVGEGGILAANSFLNTSLPDWEVWGGAPARKVGTRDRDTVLPLYQRFLEAFGGPPS